MPPVSWGSPLAPASEQMPGVREGSAQRANLSGQGLLRDQWQPSLRQCPSSGQGVWGSQWGCPDRAQPLEPSTPSPRVGTSSRIALPSPSDTSPWHRTQQAGCACDSEFLPPSGVPWGFTLRARGSRHHPGLSAGNPAVARPWYVYLPFQGHIGSSL